MCPSAPWLSGLLGVAMAVTTGAQPLDEPLPTTADAASAHREVPSQWMTVTVDTSAGVSAEGVVMVVDLASREMDWRHVALSVLVMGPDGTERSVPLPPTNDTQFAALLEVPTDFDAENVRVRAEGTDQNGRPFEHFASPLVISRAEAQTALVPPPSSQDVAPAEVAPSPPAVTPTREESESQSPGMFAAAGAVVLVCLSGFGLVVWRRRRSPGAKAKSANGVDEEIEAIASSVERELRESAKPAASEADSVAAEPSESVKTIGEAEVSLEGTDAPVAANSESGVDGASEESDEMLEELLGKIGQSDEEKEGSRGDEQGNAPDAEEDGDLSQSDIDRLFDQAKAGSISAPESHQGAER